MIAPFNKKIKLFVKGRRETFSKLAESISGTDKVVWMHCASLGEFEQGRPILEKFKREHPEYKIVLTFFSPSGFEVIKQYEMADVVCYLPLDTRKNVQRFLELANPELAIIVKYEFWPNLLRALKKRTVETILISGIFRKKQAFFSWYGAWMRKSLTSFSHFFVQDKNSLELLNSIHFTNVTLAGDTRFDRVYEITQQNNQLDFINEFKNNCYTVVAGSTWKDDEKLLVDYINNSASENEKFIIAPHNIHTTDILDLKNTITKKTVLHSEKARYNLQDFQVFILDTIGILTKVYSFADVAYVGGGYTKTGVHNVLEPATFGIPIIIGPNYHKFIEVVDLVGIKACSIADNSEKLLVILNEFYTSKVSREEKGALAIQYIEEKRGATDKILNYLKR